MFQFDQTSQRKLANTIWMASGARPCSNQRTESATNGRKPRGGHSHLHDHVDQCVVCGGKSLLGYDIWTI